MGTEDQNRPPEKHLKPLRSPVMPVLMALALDPNYRNPDGTFSPGNQRVLDIIEETTGRLVTTGDIRKMYDSLVAHHPDEQLPERCRIRGGSRMGRVRRPSPETLRTRAVLQTAIPQARTADIAQAAHVSEQTVRNVRKRG